MALPCALLGRFGFTLCEEGKVWEGHITDGILDKPEDGSTVNGAATRQVVRRRYRFRLRKV